METTPHRLGTGSEASLLKGNGIYRIRLEPSGISKLQANVAFPTPCPLPKSTNPGGIAPSWPHWPSVGPLGINQVPVERESIYFSQQHHIVRDGAQWRDTTFHPTTGTSRIKDEKIHRANCSHFDTGGHHQKIMSFFSYFYRLLDCLIQLMGSK